MKVYVITKGLYSDYHIITATTDEALARSIAKKYSRNIHDIDDRARVEAFDDAEEKLLPFWDVRFSAKGDLERIINVQPESYNGTEINIRKDGTAYGGVFAPNVEAAIKIAAEKRAMELAKKNGL